MSNAKVCDRCGRIFNYKRQQFVTLKPVRYILGVATRKRVMWGEPPKNCYEEFDLCNDCYDSFNRFLGGQSTDSVFSEVKESL